MTPKQQSRLLHWLNNILEPYDKAVEKDVNDDGVPTPEWFKIGCVLRELIKEIEAE